MGGGTGAGTAVLRDVSLSTLLAGAAAIAMMWFVVQMLEWAWWSPRRMDRVLRAQGLRGTQYRFLKGDLKEEQRLKGDAWSRPVPMDRAHNIVPRVAPLLHRVMKDHDDRSKWQTASLHAPSDYKDYLSCYCKVSFTWFGPCPRITIGDPELVREVLSNKFGHFEKTKLARLARLLVGGLATLDGEQWAKHRRIMNPAFHAEKLKRMLPSFSASCSDLISRWENSASLSVGEIELDVWSELQSLSGDVISRAAFGVTSQEGSRIFLLQTEQAERLIQSFRTNYIPGFSLLPTENNRRMKAINTEVEEMLRGLIEKRQQSMKNGVIHNDDLLGLLLEANADYSDADGKSSKGMTMEDVIGECKLFYFAGMETTAVLLTWTIVVLSMHPEWQDRAREEVLQVFGQNKPDLNGINRLKIVAMVFNEVLRLYPPVVLINRRTYKEIELGGVTYPPGVMLALNIMSIHRDPAIWGGASDEFNPGRFAEGVTKACSDPGSFFPFSWGPRNCIGQNFALLEAKVAISMILQRFTFELSPSYVHAPCTVLTLHPQHDVPLRLRRL